MNKREYVLSPKISIPDLVAALRGLEQDANAIGAERALRYIKSGNEEDLRLAEQAIGQEEILHSLVWALSGTAEEEGCEPSIDIR